MINIVQAQALNYILTKKSFSLVTYNNLDETYFPTFIEEYRYIKTHLDKYGNVPDKETFIQKFPDFELIEVNESEQYLLNQLKEDYLYRSLVPDINKIVDLMSNNKTDKALSYLIQASHKVNQRTSIEPVDLISQCQMRYDTYKEKCENVSQAYSATGLPELDEIIGGWDRKEELAVIAAKTNMGKSWWLTYFALQSAKQGLRVGFYSGEMLPEKIGYRLDTFYGNISNWGLTHGDINLDMQYKNLLTKMQNEIKTPLYVVTPEMLDGNATVTKLRGFIEKFDLDILYVDQISLMEDERKGKINHEAISNIMKDLKTIQTIKHIPIILNSQLNREERENGITIENVAGSFDVMRYATTALILEQKEKEGTNSRIVLTIGKARDSQVGDKLTYIWDINFGRLIFVPTENDATKGSHIEDLKQEYGDIGENLF